MASSPHPLSWAKTPTAFLFGFLAGMAIWRLSPELTGCEEPWDAPGKYYLGALFLAGALVALVQPRAFWMAPFSVFLGQLAYGWYFLDLADSPFRALGMVTAAAYSTAALAGALACALAMAILGLAWWLCRLLCRLLCRFGAARAR